MSTLPIDELRDAEPAIDAEASELLKQWLGLSSSQRRAFRALIEEIELGSGFVEQTIIRLGGNFRDLIDKVDLQTKQIAQIQDNATTLTVDGDRRAIDDVISDTQKALLEGFQRLDELTGKAGAMVTALDDAVAHLGRVREAVADIERINRKTNQLALNATIEAERAGAAGAAFGVVANEVKQLSSSVGGLAARIRSSVSAVAEGVENGQTILGDVSALSLDTEKRSQDQLDRMLETLSAQNSRLQSMAVDASRGSVNLSQSIGELISDLQFQDRFRQRFADVVTAMDVIARSAALLEKETAEAGFTPHIVRGADDGQFPGSRLTEKVVADLQLDEVRKRFIDAVLSGKTTPDGYYVIDEPDGTEDGEDRVELF